MNKNIEKDIQDYIREHPEFVSLWEKYGCNDWSDFNGMLPEPPVDYNPETFYNHDMILETMEKYHQWLQEQHEGVGSP